MQPFCTCRSYINKGSGQRARNFSWFYILSAENVCRTDNFLDRLDNIYSPLTLFFKIDRALYGLT